MKRIRDVWPDITSDGHGWIEDGPGGYGDLITKTFEMDVVAEGHDDDWSGDSFYLFKGGDGRLWFLTFGWGSCSGCDAFQACSRVEQLEELQAELHRGLRPFETAHAFLGWLANDEYHESQFYGRSGGWDRFTAAAKEAL